MRTWFVPSISGDYRLEAVAGKPDSVLLTVEDLTPAEREEIAAFREAGTKAGWWPTGTGVPDAGRSEILLSATVATIGPILAAKAVKDNPGVLTAIRSTGGKLEVTHSLDRAAELATAAAAEAATTVRRATPSCPHPVVGPEVRASEALRAFCSVEQWRSWISRGWLVARGNLTGHLYRLAHRNSRIAAEQTRICFDLSDRGTIHFHDVLLPPAEEVLAAKLILEHREDWLRNEATCLGNAHFRHVFQNPLGPGLQDGIADAAFSESFGRGWLDGMRLMRGLPPLRYGFSYALLVTTATPAG